ncbi:MAG: hypothetical protein JHC81_04945 [Brevundimonas sp.]|uniref:hypothetical protein n=1 Tax=Brevundimonas sp. TaxID=1871086 RepID=UPI001A31DF03|nr:hypothetical protein [Brevundimonas sp.]MBJ7446862.1 hypothetical protein [Brevundimonas sp.]
MGKPVLSDLDFAGGAKITGLPQATANGQPLTFEQLGAALEGLAWKDDVRAASTANINLASPGASIDGVTMVANDRFLAKNQTAGAENGIYVWNGAAVAATRASDMNVSAEFNSATVPVVSGTTNAGTTWRQTTASPVVGTTSVVFTSFNAGAGAASETSAGIAEIATQAEADTGTDDVRFVTPLKLANYSGRARRYATDIGDGSNTAITVTHNLTTRDVQVVVRRNSGSYEEILVDWGATTVNTITLTFAAAPGAAQYRVIVIA